MAMREPSYDSIRSATADGWGQAAPTGRRARSLTTAAGGIDRYLADPSKPSAKILSVITAGSAVL
jgi:hypothetical protein